MSPGRARLPLAGVEFPDHAGRARGVEGLAQGRVGVRGAVEQFAQLGDGREAAVRGGVRAEQLAERGGGAAQLAVLGAVRVEQRLGERAGGGVGVGAPPYRSRS